VGRKETESNPVHVESLRARSRQDFNVQGPLQPESDTQ